MFLKIKETLVKDFLTLNEGIQTPIAQHTVVEQFKKGNKSNTEITIKKIDRCVAY
jgi:hypothetical protein